MILELGLRYHPASLEMVEPHKAKVAALIEDLAEMPLKPLASAIDHWKRTSEWMPKTSDLIALTRTFSERQGIAGFGSKIDQATARNFALDSDATLLQTARWVQDDRGCRLVSVKSLAYPVDPQCTPEQAAEARRLFGV